MPQINVAGGYTPGAIGAIVSLHAKYYATSLDRGPEYEARIATELSAFLVATNPDRDLFLLASIYGMTAGSLSVDGRGLRTGEARLRWLVLHPLYSPNEVCSALVKEALRFCRRKNYRRVVLVAYKNDDLFQRLTGDWGFELIEEVETKDWSHPMRQQVFELSGWRTRSPPR
jgi:N-acetylglutamate synthase-like GNAT family acetyltransferase